MEQLGKLLSERSSRLPDADRIVARWIAAVHDLGSRTEQYLGPLQSKQNVLIDRHTEEMSEEGLGTYRIERWSYRFNGVPGAVELRPVSPLIVGLRAGGRRDTRGRVDLEYGGVRISLALLSDAWVIALADDDLQPFNESTFERALLRLLD